MEQPLIGYIYKNEWEDKIKNGCHTASWKVIICDIERQQLKNQEEVWNVAKKGLRSFFVLRFRK